MKTLMTISMMALTLAGVSAVAGETGSQAAQAPTAIVMNAENQVSPEDVAKSAAFCVYEYQYVCNPYTGYCVWKYVYICY